jgi:hypothetical protein
MNNEPVAWMFQGAFDISTYVSFEKPNPDIYPNPTPLYTHPVKELTDEEISEVIEKIANNNEYVYSLYEDFEGIEFSRIGIFDFARAILRKAQEK